MPEKFYDDWLAASILDEDRNLDAFSSRFEDLSQKFEVDLNILAALNAASDEIYVYPGMSSDFSIERSQIRASDIGTFIEHYDIAFVRGFEPDVEVDTNRRSRRMMYGHQAVQAMVRTLETSPQGKQLLETLPATEQHGLSRAGGAYALNALNTTHYFFEVGVRDDFIINYPPLFRLGEYAFGADYDPGSVLMSQLAARLREMGVVDLSKDLLDARFEHFSAMAQFDASRLFLEDLIWLARLGGRRQALLLANKYKEDLLADDYGRKIDMQNDLTSVLFRAAMQSHSPTGRKALQSLGRRAGITVKHLQESYEGFSRTYMELGYDLPAALIEDDEAVNAPTLTSKTQINTPKIKEAGKSVDDEKLGVEIASEADSLKLRLDAFTREWRMSARQRREAGLNQMQHELVNGFRDFTGRAVLPQMSKEDARQLVDIMHRLHSITLTDGDARQSLNNFLKLQNELQEDIDLLQMMTTDAELLSDFPFVPSISGYVEMFAEDWSAYRQLILKTWPNYAGSTAARHLEGLLFEGQVHEIVDDASTAEAIVFQDEVAAQLDQIILPPGANQGDLERELSRVGASETKVNKILWERLSELIEIRSQFDGTLFRSKDRSLGSSPSYFVAVFQFGGDTFAVAESPVFGNATYVVSEKHAPGTWLEVLELSKIDARSVGAERIIHSTKTKGGIRHIDKVYDQILKMHES